MLPRQNHPVKKDMYWFAHGGAEISPPPPKATEGEEELNEQINSPSGRLGSDRRSPLDDLRGLTHTDGSSSSGPSSLEDRLHLNERRVAAEERRKQLWEAEQERNEAVLKKRLEREAALEAKRNAQRSTTSFAFGSSVPRNIETLNTHQGVGDSDTQSRSSLSPGFTQRGEDLMSKSMTTSLLATCGRRKNDLMPTVPYDRTISTPRAAAASSSQRKRSVSMTRLDQLAMPRKHYVEAIKASSGNKENVRSPTRPLSSASEHSGGTSTRAASTVTRRGRTSPRKPRPVSIAGTLPDARTARTPESRVSPLKTIHTLVKKVPESGGDVKKAPAAFVKNSTPKSLDKTKPSSRPSSATKPSTPKQTQPKTNVARTPRATESKTPSSKNASPVKTPATKLVGAKKPSPVKAKVEKEVQPVVTEEKMIENAIEMQEVPSPDLDLQSESEKNNGKRIISEEEAKAALAEKRRLAREQAEKEAELEKLRQEEIQRAEEERLRLEEEERVRQEEFMVEQRRQEDEKLQRAIQEQQQKEEEERTRKEEETRTRAEQEKKAKEEAERQKIELEEKLRKEEEERAERKKRLEKIMSRTRGKSNATSPTGSVSGSDQYDSSDNPQEDYSSGANSLESKEGEPREDALALEDKSDEGDSLDANPTYEVVSEGESLNSNDLMMPTSETASQDNSLVLHETKPQEIKVEVEILQADTIPSQEGEVALHVALNVHAAEFTPAGFGAFGSLQQEHITFQESDVPASQHAAPFQEYQGGEINQTGIMGDVDLQFRNDDADLQHTVPSELFSKLDTNPIGDCESDQIDGFRLPDPEGSDLNLRGSVSSDIKLPDPIYDTSEEGSVSSERLQHDFRSYSHEEPAFNKGAVVADDVFSDHIQVESEAKHLKPLGQQMFPDDGMSDFNPFSDKLGGQSPFDMSAGIYDGATSSDVISPELENQPASSVFDIETHFDSTAPAGLDFPSNENDTSHLTPHNEFLANDFGSENPFNSSVNEFSVNPFDTSFNSNTTVHDSFGQISKGESEQISVLPNQTDLGNITLIKGDDKNSCIGIISSVDHDLASNDFPRPSLNVEQHRMNFGYSSVTDSEDSSVDSNLSQVEASLKKDALTGLNGDSVLESSVSNGVESRESKVNGSSKTNGNHFYSDAITNGHTMEHLEHSRIGADILNVESSGHSIFENESAADYGIGAADPFLAKGASMQNPFLVQDDPSHVLVTSDFLK